MPKAFDPRVGKAVAKAVGRSSKENACQKLEYNYN